MTYFLFTTGRSHVWTSSFLLSVREYRSTSHLIKLLCFGRSIQALVPENFLVESALTRFPGLLISCVLLSIYIISFCYGCIKTLNTDWLYFNSFMYSSSESTQLLGIRFVSPGCILSIFPSVSWITLYFLTITRPPFTRNRRLVPWQSNCVASCFKEFFDS